MLKRCLALLVVLIIALTTVFPVLASNITGAKWHGTLRITNTGAAVTGVSTNFTLNTAELINDDFLNATATNYAILYNSSDVASMPGWGSNPWCVFVPTIGAGQNLNFDFYTDNVTGGTIRYFPGSTGMAVTDHASLEPSANFTIEFTDTYLDTTAGFNKPIFRKSNAIEAMVDPLTSGSIYVNIGATTQFEDDFVADSWTDVGTQIAVDTVDSRLEYTALDIQAVDQRSYIDLTTINNSLWYIDFTFRNTAYAGGTTSYHALSLGSALNNFQTYPGDDIGILTAGGAAPAVLIYYHDGGGAPTYSGTITHAYNTTYYTRLIRTSGISATLSVYSDAAMTTHITGSPVTLVIPATVTGLRYLQSSGYNYGGAAGNTITGWIDSIKVFKGMTGTALSAAGIASGEKSSIKTELDGVNMNLLINGVQVGTVALGGAVPNTATSLYLGIMTATPYISGMEITVGGVSKGEWEWRYAATFLDLSGNGNTGTPSFRTTSSDADVSAVLVSLDPVTEAEFTTGTIASSTGVVLGTPDAPIQLYTDEDYSKIPFADVVNAFIDASGTSSTTRLPRAEWWFTFIFGVIGIGALCMYGVTVHNGAPGTLWAPIIVIEAGYIVAGLLNPIGFWNALLFVIPALTILTADKHQSMG